MPNFAARATAADVLVYRASGEIPAWPHPGIRFPAGESRAEPPTFVLRAYYLSVLATAINNEHESRPMPALIDGRIPEGCLPAERQAVGPPGVRRQASAGVLSRRQRVGIRVSI